MPVTRRAPTFGWLIAMAIVTAACQGVEASPQGPETTMPGSTTTKLAPPTTSVPPTSTTVAPATAAAAPIVPVPPARRRLVINGTGDVNLDPGFVRSFPTTGYEYAWTGLDGLFAADDLTVVNLECSASDLGTPWDKPYTFRCDPAALPSMAAAGVEVANLANNHAIDYGFEAMLDARRNLEGNGIAPVGAGRDAVEAYQPALFEINGWTVAVLGGGGVHPETGSWIVGEDRPGMTDGDSAEAMTAAIRAADELADLVIVTIHWGEQGATTPRAFEIELAHAFIDAGADGIFGHHQHRLNPLGWYRGKPIAWGLGNFVWQAYPERARQTAVAQFVFEPDGSIGACLVPVIIEEPGHPVVQTPDPTPCVIEEAE
jgi:poly-gamma-glutamate synthesis protein (capsule biosynthesis protein)